MPETTSVSPGPRRSTDPGRRLNLAAVAAVTATWKLAERRVTLLDDGSRPGFAELRLASVTTGTRGKVDLVAPFAIHAEQGGPARSVAIILRSQRLGEGTVLQHAYDPASRTVAERYGPTQIPYDLSAGA